MARNPYIPPKTNMTIEKPNHLKVYHLLKVVCHVSFQGCNTVDGRNLAPLRLPHQLVRDFFHQQYHVFCHPFYFPSLHSRINTHDNRPFQPANLPKSYSNSEFTPEKMIKHGWLEDFTAFPFGEP